MIKGKCFSKVNRGKRNKNDLYQTPPSLTQEIINREMKDELKGSFILEPACGFNAIVNVLKDNGFYNIDHTDLAWGKDLNVKRVQGIDFFKLNDDKYNFYMYEDFNKKIEFSYCEYEFIKYQYVITNPPYSLAKEFVLNAKKICRKKIIMLLKLDFLHGQNRLEELWRDKEFPLKKVYVLSRYPMLKDTVRDDGKFNTGMQTYGWYVWEKEYKGNPEIEWIDINKYVVRKGE